MSTQHKLSVFSYNCYGINSSLNEIVEELRSNSNIAFICEHWQHQHELVGLKAMLAREGYWSHMKSSIDPEEVLQGRPYGGVGFICKRIQGLIYKPIEVDNDRITGVQLIQSGKVILNIVGVYLPYYDGTPDQVALYSETLDVLQSVLDMCPPSPVMIVGDMNASLPTQKKLSGMWYRQSPYNQHSLLLYDFLCSNDLCVANFAYGQSVDYTYTKGNKKSYIDHVFLSRYSFEQLTNCSIVDFNVNDEWSSDHLPIRTEILMNIDSGATTGENKLQHPPVFAHVNWDHPDSSVKYKQFVADGLQAVHKIDVDDIVNVSDAQRILDDKCDEITRVIHAASEKTVNGKTSNYKGKYSKTPWWSYDCQVTRDRARFWRSLWAQCGKPRTGAVYNCYKSVKKAYRQACRQAVSSNHRARFNMINTLYRCRNMKQFWNRIRMCKDRCNQTGDEIAISCLTKFYSDKFSEEGRLKTDTIIHAEMCVQRKYDDIGDNIVNDYVFSENSVVKYIKRLKAGCAAGCDGVTAEHLKHSLETDMPEHLSCILTICARFGIVPQTFALGILVPILKKPNIDPSIAKHYRPVIVSTVFSKIMEMCILEESSDHKFHDLQFGFIETRGTNMAICLAQDVINYCNTRGSPVFTCALDAEMAFDGIPHSILLYKSMDVIPDLWWRILYKWYGVLHVQIKWNKQLSEPIRIEKGTRQGGLTSPFLFNLFYQDMIAELNNTTGGIKINRQSYNVFAYADDLLLTSTTVSGLQRLINNANEYITENGLSFNATKTECVTFGKCHLEPSPSWSLNGTKLSEETKLSYLGAVLSNDNHAHVHKRMQACRQKFFSLQGAGMCPNGVKPNVAAHLWKSALQPVLSYACQSLPLYKTDIQNMDKIQAKLIKTSLGLSKYMRTTPLLNALYINSISDVIDVYTLNMYKMIMFSNTGAKSLYTHILNSDSHAG